ncbi:DUF58 domain-containing protein [Roseimaritima ulvae]|uniref:VWA domain containing CoxE-like protein n=1 Tax=Roseimaritima ulvae TaxID=980254 RepID=A0A5B9QVM9_9BACT|nr:DUF58 domain-containing protein [Roseimaritima ulvae]QEG41435.1 VWA domain containing CoxE-like protein [Roseimaritima ulvae]
MSAAESDSQATRLQSTRPVSQRRVDSVDPATLMRIKNLVLRAKTVVEGFFSGLHRSPFHGFSAEFSEYRPYTVGEDLRNLDWKLYARSDRFFVKRFEDETSRRCYFVVDQSRSMGFDAQGYSKAEYAKTVAATLAYFLTLSRDSVGLMTFDQTIADYVPARHRHGHLRQLMICLERAVAGQGTDLALPLESIAATIRKRGMIVLISDMLTPLDQMRTRLGYLRSRGHEVIILRVLDPAEIDFRLAAPSLVTDLETDQEMYIDPDTAAADYRLRFDAHEAELQSICNDLGIDFYRLPTDGPLDVALFDLINAQSRRGRTVMRNRGSRGPVASVGGSR